MFLKSSIILSKDNFVNFTFLRSLIDGRPNDNKGKGGRNGSKTNRSQGNSLGGIDNKTIRRSKSDVDNLLLKGPFTPLYHRLNQT